MRKKLERLWFYDKWYLMAGAGVLLLLLNFWAQKARTPKPDYYVSIVTGNQISESTREGYAARLETVLDDRNGDGKVTVMVTSTATTAVRARLRTPRPLWRRRCSWRRICGREFPCVI